MSPNVVTSVTKWFQVSRGLRWEWLISGQSLEARLVADDKRGAFDLQQLLLLEVGEEPGDRLARRSDHLGNFLVCECQRGSNLRASLSVVGTPIQKKTRQFFSSRMREPNGPHFCNGGVVRFAQLLGYTEGNFAVLTEKIQKIVSRDEIRLRGLDHTRGELIGLARDCGRQPQYFSRLRNSDDQSFSIDRVLPQRGSPLWDRKMLK
jgi:hypothetical protein